jgi:hypothetical protein
MGSPPDLNAETYPFDVVQQLLNQAAYFNLYSRSAGSEPVALPGGALSGFRLRERLCRFSIAMSIPSQRAGLLASNLVGEPVGTFEHRWMIIPERFAARPGVEPPSTAFDPSASQRFVMLDSVFTLAGNVDGFRGFGTGRTEPARGAGGGEVAVAAVGTIVDGFGRFRGCAGTYTYCGALTREGFRGSVLLRVADPGDVFTADSLSPATTSEPVPERDVTYLLLAGRKRSRASRTNYVYADGDRITGFEVEPQLRLLNVDCGEGAHGAIHCASSIGPVVGLLNSRVTIDLLNPGAPGTDTEPIPFVTQNRFAIVATDGTTLGSFDVGGGEGRTFTMTLPAAPGQQALRFGAFGGLSNGQGRFMGITGQLADNSAVGVAPHAIATTYLLRVFDPGGLYRIDAR